MPRYSTIRLSTDVKQLIKKRGEFGESYDDVLRKILQERA